MAHFVPASEVVAQMQTVLTVPVSSYLKVWLLLSLPYFPQWPCQKGRWQCRAIWSSWELRWSYPKASLRHRQALHFWEQQTVGSSRVAFIRGVMAGLPVLPLPFSGADGKFKPGTLSRGWLPLLRVLHMLAYHWRLHPEMVVGVTAWEGKAFPIIGHLSIWPLLTATATKPICSPQSSSFPLAGQKEESK